MASIEGDVLALEAGSRGILDRLGFTEQSNAKPRPNYPAHLVDTSIEGEPGAPSLHYLGRIYEQAVQSHYSPSRLASFGGVVALAGADAPAIWNANSAWILYDRDEERKLIRARWAQRAAEIDRAMEASGVWPGLNAYFRREGDTLPDHPDLLSRRSAPMAGGVGYGWNATEEEQRARYQRLMNAPQTAPVGLAVEGVIAMFDPIQSEADLDRRLNRADVTQALFDPLDAATSAQPHALASQTHAPQHTPLDPAFGGPHSIHMPASPVRGLENRGVGTQAVAHEAPSAALREGGSREAASWAASGRLPSVVGSPVVVPDGGGDASVRGTDVALAGAGARPTPHPTGSTTVPTRPTDLRGSRRGPAMVDDATRGLAPSAPAEPGPNPFLDDLTNPQPLILHPTESTAARARNAGLPARATAFGVPYTVETLTKMGLSAELQGRYRISSAGNLLVLRDGHYHRLSPDFPSRRAQLGYSNSQLDPAWRLDLVEYWRDRGLVRDVPDGTLEMFDIVPGKWYPQKDIDMGHIVPAVEHHLMLQKAMEARYLADPVAAERQRRNTVRTFMRDFTNYLPQLKYRNRSMGAESPYSYVSAVTDFIFGASGRFPIPGGEVIEAEVSETE